MVYFIRGGPTLLPGVQPPLTSPTTPTAQEYLKSGSGVVSNRSLFSIPHKNAGADITEMNIGDASNSQRLRAAGLTEAQLYNSQNIFVHLGQKDGKDQYGFYSKGFGEGDERTGVVTVGADGKISSSLGAGWAAADPTQQTQLKTAFEAREKLVKEKFAGNFDTYKNFETARAQVDDLLARGDVTGVERTSLTSLKTEMAKTSETSFNADLLQKKADSLLSTHSTTLQQIRQAEAAGKVADGADITNETKLKAALEAKTKEVNAVEDIDKTAYSNELDVYKNKLKDLQGSTDPKIKAFLAAQKHLESKKEGPDKTTLAELKWQNARFDRMMKDDHTFKAAVDAARTPTPTSTPTSVPAAAAAPTAAPTAAASAADASAAAASAAATPTPTPTPTPTRSNNSIKAEEMAKELGFVNQEGNQSFLEQLKVIDGNVDQYSSRGITISTPSDTNSNEVLITQGDKHFLYNRNSQSARSLTPVTGSQDAFYDASEPSTLLLKNPDKTFIKDEKSHNAFTYGAIGLLAYPSDEKSQNASTFGAIGPLSEYIFKDGKWQLISQKSFYTQ